MSGDPQAVFIDGGRTFKSREDYLDFLKNREVSIEDSETWYSGDYLEESLDIDVVRLKMPCRNNVRYEEWRITFERYLPLLSDRLVLIGLSLGGTFLAKYLSENDFPKEIVAAYLLGAPYDDDLPEEDLAGGFNPGPDLSILEKNCESLTLMFSEDDYVVPVRHAEKFREKLSGAEIKIFEGKEGHFKVSEFPELVEAIKRNGY